MDKNKRVVTYNKLNTLLQKKSLINRKNDASLVKQLLRFSFTSRS